MKHNLLVLAIAMSLPAPFQPVRAQTEAVDTAQFVAIYDYDCRTQDDEGSIVTDHMQVVVQVGRLVTKSMPGSAYRAMDDSEEADVAAAYQEAYLHMPTVWTGLPAGQTTVREFIFPHEYEGYERLRGGEQNSGMPTPNIAWTLTEDTMTVSGYFCQQATATFRDVEWHVYYTDEIPSSAGPWRLRGLPGLIIKAESEAHTFCLVELQQKASPITPPEQRPDVQRMKYAKLLKHKNEIYGNRQYVKNPMYYAPDFMDNISNMYVFNTNGQQRLFVNGHPLLTKGHVYQPLEKE